MADSFRREPKVLLVRLYEKTSGKGNRYFAGRMGAAKVVMLRDDRAAGTDPIWQLFVSDGEPQQGKQRQSDRAGTVLAKAPPAAAEPQR